MVSVLLIFFSSTITRAVRANELGGTMAIDFRGSRIALLNDWAHCLPVLGGFDVLSIDGKWLEEQAMMSSKSPLIAEIKDAILSGVPTVIFGGNIHPDEIVDGVMRHTVNQPLTAHAIKVYKDRGIEVTDLMPLDQHCKLLKGSEYALLPSDQLLIGGNTSVDDATARAYDWAIKRVSHTGDSTISSVNHFTDQNKAFEATSSITNPVSASSDSDPEWLLFGTVTLSTQEWSDKGKLDATQYWYVLNNSGSNTYDWWNVVLETTSTPGRVAYGSDWRTADIWNWMDVDYYGEPNLLIDYGPPTTTGVSTVSYEIGVEAGEQGARVTCKMPVSYSAQDVSIENQSDPSKQLARWWHDVPEGGDNGMNTYTIKPGTTIRVEPIAPTSVVSSYQVQYSKPNIWPFPWDYWKSPEIRLRTILPYARTTHFFVVEADDSPNWWVGDISNVEAGFVEALNDADAYTLAKISDEVFYAWAVTSTEVLASLAYNPPLHAVMINAHGEMVPMSSWYFGPSIHITSPSDGGTIYSSPTVYADVHPPSGCSLQSFQPDGYTEWAYVWCMWYRPSTGDSQWKTMYPNTGGGGTYYRYMSLPAYDTYEIYVIAIANYLDSVAHITVDYQYSGGGGGCPYLSVWNGTHYVTDNNLLRGGFSETDITDHYKLEQNLVPNGDGTYSMTLSEYETEHNFIDQVRLLAIDHSPRVNIAVSPEGQIMTYRRPTPPRSAIDDKGDNVRLLINSVDENYYEGYNGSYIILNFGNLDTSRGAKLVLRADRPPVKVSIHVQVQDENGDWNDIASFVPRHHWATEIIDMSEHLPDANGELKVRLYFTANHKLDFVGLDTSPQAQVKVQECKLLSARHTAGLEVTGTNGMRSDTTCKSDILDSDDSYAELTPGHRIEMNLSKPTKTGRVRDFIFVIEGYYKKAGSPYACTVVWQEWFDLLEDRTRNYGWIWVNVAGYSCYYFGNTWYDSKIPIQYREIPGEDGLKQFLSKDVASYHYDGHWARIGAAFANRAGFHPQIYNDLPTTDIAASRPLPKTAELPWNTVGFVDTSTDDSVTASIAMNASSLDSIMTGIFVHSGLASDTSDWLKGYIATVLAIEEARAFIMMPKTLTQTEGNVHAATFSVTMLPGGWGESNTPITFPDSVTSTYRYVNLMLTISTHYEDYSRYDPPIFPDQPGINRLYSLSEADFILDGTDTEVWGEIDLCKSGWETGDDITEFMDALGWWGVGLTADMLGEAIQCPYLGSALGLIPILIRGPDPPEERISLNRPVWANRTSIDPNDDDWGTMTFYFRVIFRRDGLPRDYEFTLGMSSWIDYWMIPDWGIPDYTARYKSIQFTEAFQFEVTS